MPTYLLSEGRRAVVCGHLLDAGEKILLDEDVAGPLVATGLLVASEQAPPASRRVRRRRPEQDDGDED